MHHVLVLLTILMFWLNDLIIFKQANYEIEVELCELGAGLCVDVLLDGWYERWEVRLSYVVGHSCPKY